MDVMQCVTDFSKNVTGIKILAMLIRSKVSYLESLHQKLPNCRCSHLGVLWSSGGTNMYEGYIYFELNMSARQDTYFDRHFAWLKYKYYLSLTASTDTGPKL
jgi:hypothetical protein